MRDIDRIPLFLEAVGKLWKEKCPDYRFGQLMENFRRLYGDPFYLEEDEFLEKLEEMFDSSSRRKNIDFSLLLLVGFDENDLQWLQGTSREVLETLSESYYTSLALINMTAMLEQEFSSRTTLALWVQYPQSFVCQDDIFKQDLEYITNKFGKNNIQDFFWKHGEFEPFEYIGDSEEEKRMAIERTQEKFKEDWHECMSKLVDVGFEEHHVRELEETCTEFCLEYVREYFMEPTHLEKLSTLLEAGFHEYLLLQFYIDDPEKIVRDAPIDKVVKRIEDMEDLWQGYQMLEERFVNALFGEDDSEWQEVLDIINS